MFGHKKKKEDLFKLTVANYFDGEELFTVNLFAKTCKMAYLNCRLWEKLIKDVPADENLSQRLRDLLQIQRSIFMQVYPAGGPFIGPLPGESLYVMHEDTGEVSYDPCKFEAMPGSDTFYTDKNRSFDLGTQVKIGKCFNSLDTVYSWIDNGLDGHNISVQDGSTPAQLLINEYKDSLLHDLAIIKMYALSKLIQLQVFEVFP